MTVHSIRTTERRFAMAAFYFLAGAAVTVVAATLNFQISMVKNMPFPSALKPLIMENDNVTVEDLMYKYKSDKSRDDHGYTKLYNMLFSTLRNSVTNMTEVGISAGQSVQAWYRYFPNAEMHVFDVCWLSDNVKVNMDMLKPRVQAHIVNILDGKVGSMEELGFIPASMDIIIEDGPHSVASQEDFLIKLFPLLKPGGFYIIEDVGYNQNGMLYFHDNPSKLRKETREILESHDTIWVDTSIGHRSWDEWLRRAGEMWAANHTHHNSYCVVIQKRETALQPMQMFLGDGAMNSNHVVHENGGKD